MNSPIQPPPTAIARPLDLARCASWFVAVLAVSVVAFWPSYISQLSAQSAYTHWHAITATLWLLLLIAQPLAIRTGRRGLHRALGRASLIIAPMVVLTIVLLAHQQMQRFEGERLLIQTYILYLQLSLAAIFALCYAMAIWYRRNRAVHMRFMILTGVTFIDPVVVRLMFQIAPEPAWNYQLFTFALTNTVICLLIWFDRRSPAGRWVFPLMLAVFLTFQIPALLGLTFTPPWQSFAAWFAALGAS